MQWWKSDKLLVHGRTMSDCGKFRLVKSDWDNVSQLKCSFAVLCSVLRRGCQVFFNSKPRGLNVGIKRKVEIVSK